MRFLLAVLITLLAGLPAAHAAEAPNAWPPREGPGHVFVHYGEEHWNDIDGEAVLTQLVADVARYRPDLVTMSGDKTDDGTPERLEPWRRIMARYDDARVPYMAGVGNHDGKQMTPEAVTEAAAGSTPLRDITHYKQVFADRPYPMGDAAPYDRPLMAPKARPADDPAGAATHFWVDYGNVRWVFIDNSCYGIINCDPLQSPPDGRGRTQYEFLRDAGAEADAAGKLLFVVMHMPTRDPRDQQQSYYTSVSHTMGKGISPDNTRFEEEAEAIGVDAVFLGHIKGQFLYRGRGDIPYYIDGGAGGELYTTGPLGVDHGYWYGWRMLRVDGSRVETDVVPVIAPGGIRLEGPDELKPGGAGARFEAFARQPASKSDRGVVTALELRDPDPIPRPQQAAGIPGWIYLTPFLLLPLLALRSAPRRLVAVGAAGVAVVGGGVAYGQRSVPTATPKDALPNPARIFTSSNPLVLAPVASETDDPRRDPRSQTADGAFRSACPGRAWLTVTSGWEQTAKKVTVPSAPGRIVRSVRRGRGRTVATVRLAQRAIVTAEVRRRGKLVKRFAPACRQAGAVRLRTARTRRGDVVEVTVRSDRKSTFRRWRAR